MMDRYVVGGFYQVHAERGVDETSTPRRELRAAAFEQSTHLPAARHQAQRQRA